MRWRLMAVAVSTAVAAAVLSPATSAAPVFDDVAADAYYADAVEWLAASAITEGTSDTTFSPDAFVNRAQMATFLARFGEYTGTSPEAGFSDVVSGSYYDAPVDWLVEHAITTGTSATTYSPSDFVTRAQMAAFLWRFAGRIPSNVALPFTDVVEGSWYSTAVEWLVENGITTGTSNTTYSPDAFVTRGQMATFLWRLAGSPEADEPGENRTPSSPVSGDGGTVMADGVTVEFQSLDGDGYVTVNVGDSGGELAALAGAVSDDVEINVAQAELDGPITITVPIDTVDLDAFELVVNVVNGDGDWEEIAVAVTTEVIEGQMYATFTLPADVPLAPSALTVEPLALLSEGGHRPLLLQLSAHPVASPPTSTTSTSSTTTSSTSTTSTIPVDAPTINASQLETDFSIGQAAFRRVFVGDGSGVYVDFRAQGLPPGLEIRAGTYRGTPVGEVYGEPTEVGSFFATVEVEDSAGAVGAALVEMNVVDPASPPGYEGTFAQHDSDRQPVAYPSTSPNGRYLAYSVGDTSELRIVDLQTDAALTEAPDVDMAAFDGYPLSDDGVWVALRRGGALVVRNTATDTETTLADVSDWRLAMTPDGAFLAFSSVDSSLSAEPNSDGRSEAYVWDRVAGTAERLTDTEEASVVMAISDDGRFVLLSSDASLTGVPSERGLFVHDRVLDALTWVADAHSGRHDAPVMTPDGSVVVFVRGDDLVHWTRSSSTAIPIATTPGWQSFDISVSDDARYVAFRNSDPTLLGGTGGPLFFWDRDTALLSDVPGAIEWYAMSGDGEVIAFHSRSTSAGPDPNGTGLDVWLWHHVDGSLERVTGGDLPAANSPIGISRNGALLWFWRGPNWSEMQLHTWDRAASLS